MIWLMTVASLLGFLAVDTLANQSLVTQMARLASYDATTWFILSVGLSIALIITISLKYVISYNFNHHTRINHPLKCHFVQLFLSTVIFLLTLTLSASFGLYQYQQYQNTLLQSAFTVDATIKSHQISDSITQTIKLSNDDIMMGNGYVRQILQVTINHQNDATALSESLHSHQLPLTALVTANIKDNPDWQTTFSQLQPGQQLKVQLQLQPIHDYQTQHLPSNAKPLNLGFDEARWLRQRGVQATGTIVSIQKNSLSTFAPFSFQERLSIAIEKIRWQIRQKILATLNDSLMKSSAKIAKATQSDITGQKSQANMQNYAILLGLLTGDKSLMDSDIKNVYQVAGISHLLAISGPHVLMLATILSVLVVWLVKMFVPKLFFKLPSSLLVLWVSVVVAGFYALLVGFELPAQRTFWMLLLLTLTKQLLFKLSAFRLLAWVAMGMIWLEPMAVGQPGFWLSFVAVVLLLKFSEKMGKGLEVDFNSVNQMVENASYQKMITDVVKLMASQVKLLLQLQIWLFVWMLPIVVWFFGKVSLSGILVNLLAVPFLGFIIVPLDMLAGVVSWLPVIGDWLSQLMWSVLANMLDVFHALLKQLINVGFANQIFLALSQTQLTVCIFIGLLWFLKGLLPRVLILPLGMLLMLLPIQQRAMSNSHPTLAVLNHPKISIILLKKGEDNWLMLSENQLQAVKADKISFLKHKKPTTEISNDEAINALLNQQIYPLLANQQVNKLTGVVSQTPSAKVNQLVQQLASHVPIQAYWLAGYDAQGSRIDGVDNTSNASFQSITPKNCQMAQTWQQEGLEVSAISGWKLDLVLSTAEKLATQTCFIQITHTRPTSQSYKALILAGNSQIPMQMSEKLCTASATNLLIQPYYLPIKQSWLVMTKPNLLHVLTGHYDSQKPSEDSQLAIASWSVNNPTLQVIDGYQVGALEYALNQPTQQR